MFSIFRISLQRATTSKFGKCSSQMQLLSPRSASVSYRRFMATESESNESKQSGSRRGPASWRHFIISMSIAVTTTAAVVYYVKTTREKRALAKQKRLEKGFGVPSIGGTWELVDYNGNVKTEKDYLGNWLLIYFGFTHCPDICPEELEKLCKVMDKIDADPKCPKPIPLFFTVDPIRDTPERMKKYCLEYSSKLLGLGGSVEQVKDVCKKFRVYFGLGPKDPDGDYIVDHTVVIYLIDPEGKYVDHFIREPSADVIFEKFRGHMVKYEEENKKNIKNNVTG